MQYIANRGARWGRNQPDALREARQRTLAFLGEEALRVELLFELFKRHLQSPDALQLDADHAQLVLAAGFVHCKAAPERYLASIFEHRPINLNFPAEQHAAHLRTGVFRGEINMARALYAQIGHLARDLDLADFLLKQPAHLDREFGDGQDAARGGGGFRREQFAKIPLGFRRLGHNANETRFPKRFNARSRWTPEWVAQGRDVALRRPRAALRRTPKIFGSSCVRGVSRSVLECSVTRRPQPKPGRQAFAGCCISALVHSLQGFFALGYRPA